MLLVELVRDGATLAADAIIYVMVSVEVVQTSCVGLRNVRYLRVVDSVSRHVQVSVVGAGVEAAAGVLVVAGRDGRVKGVRLVNCSTSCSQCNDGQDGGGLDQVGVRRVQQIGHKLKQKRSQKCSQR